MTEGRTPETDGAVDSGTAVPVSFVVVGAEDSTDDDFAASFAALVDTIFWKVVILELELELELDNAAGSGSFAGLWNAAIGNEPAGQRHEHSQGSGALLAADTGDDVPEGWIGVVVPLGPRLIGVTTEVLSIWFSAPAVTTSSELGGGSGAGYRNRQHKLPRVFKLSFSGRFHTVAAHVAGAVTVETSFSSSVSSPFKQRHRDIAYSRCLQGHLGYCDHYFPGCRCRHHRHGDLDILDGHGPANSQLLSNICKIRQGHVLAGSKGERNTQAPMARDYAGEEE
ncbi:MAG: hypothetical protein Q9174_006604, partial [Haloplaca sp. 1 TL-2023]